MRSRATSSSILSARSAKLLLLSLLFAPAMTGVAQNQSPLAEPDGRPLKSPLSNPWNLTLRPSSGIWKSTVGEGFNSGVLETAGALGVGIGMRVLLSQRAHDLALSSLDFGWIFSDVRAPDRWYRGNWEVLGEIFAGSQFQPHVDYLLGVGPLLRYN